MKPEHGAEEPQVGHFAQFFTALAYVLMICPTIYIIVISLCTPSLFSWHPICMSVAVGLFASEAVFVISGEAQMSKKLSRKKRVTVHWALHTVGLVIIIIGLIIIVVNKNNKGTSHFATTHSQLGLATIVIAFLIAGFGILANNATWFYPKVRPVLLKVVHACAGIGLLILFLATLINGTYKGWWEHVGGTDTSRGLVIAAWVILGVIVLVKPLIGAVARSRVLARPPPSEPVAMTEATTR